MYLLMRVCNLLYSDENFGSTLGQYIDRDVSGNISTNILVECQSICQPTLSDKSTESGCPIVG